MNAQDMPIETGECKARKRKFLRKRDPENPLWADTRSLPLSMNDLHHLLCWPADRVLVTLVLVKWVWITQRSLPDDIADWPYKRICATFGYNPDGRKIRRLYPVVIDDVRHLTSYRAPLFDGGREWVFAKSKGRCHHCDCVLSLDRFHIDHLRAVTRGGLTNNDNLVASCAACNLSKGAHV